MKLLMMSMCMLLLLSLSSCEEDPGHIEDSPISVKVNGKEYRFKIIKIAKDTPNNDYYTLMYAVGDTVQVIDNSKSVTIIQQK